MSRAWFLARRNRWSTNRASTLVPRTFRKADLHVGQLRIFGFETTDGNHVRISL